MILQFSEESKAANQEFIVAGLAATCAGIFTNPLEVIKIRMQLQGELQAQNKYVKAYKNVFHAAYTIVKHEGIVSLQSGLIPALWFQFFLNGIRLGWFLKLFSTM